jgi:hypothetical protein
VRAAASLPLTIVLAACPSRRDSPPPTPVTATVAAVDGGRDGGFDFEYSEGGGGPGGSSFALHVRSGGETELQGYDFVACPDAGPGRNTWLRYGSADGGRLFFRMTPEHFAAVERLTNDPEFRALPARLGTGPGSPADGMDIRIALRDGPRTQTTLVTPDWNNDKLPAILGKLRELTWSIPAEEGRLPPERHRCAR